jgi:hypothetical protein
VTRLCARKRQLLLLVGLVALAAFPASADAGVLVKSATDCSTGPLEQPFAQWGDQSRYVLHPGGSFESAPADWQLGPATVVAGNEPWRVRAAGDSRSLSIPPGTTVTTSTICVGLDKPKLRFFARSSGSRLSTLAVSVQFETSLGLVLTLPVGVVTPGDWAPTLPMPVLANLLPLLPGQQTPVRFRFAPVGAATWQIDDVYVDPRKR